MTQISSYYLKLIVTNMTSYQREILMGTEANLIVYLALQIYANIINIRLNCV